MKKVSTLFELQRFIGHIMDDKTNFLSPIKDMENNLDFFMVYDKTIELASNHFTLEITLSDIPFYIKFDLVSFVITKVLGENGMNAFLKKIYSMPFDSDSILLIEFKNDYRICVDIASLGCLLDNYIWPYILLNHMYENASNIPKKHYPILIRSLAFLLDSLSGVIQKKLYGDLNGLICLEVEEFCFSYIQSYDIETKNMVVYKRLLVEYPEILKVYEQTVNTLTQLQNIYLKLI